MKVYIILYKGQISSLAFDSEDKAFEWLEQERGVKQVFGYEFENEYSIKEVTVC